MTPVDIEGGALEPGGVPSVFSWQHIGLLAHIASVGVVYGTLSGVIYAVLNNYLYMSAVLTATAQALVRVPRGLLFSSSPAVRDLWRRTCIPLIFGGWQRS